MLAAPPLLLQAQGGRAEAELAAVNRELQKAAADLDQVIPLLERKLALQTEITGPNSIELAYTLFALVDVHGQRGDYLKAKRYATRIVSMTDRGVPMEHVIYSRLAAKLGHLYAQQGLEPNKQTLFERAIVPVMLSPVPEDKALASDLLQIGIALRAQGKIDSATSIYRIAVKVGAPSLKENHEDMAKLHNNLGSVLFDAGKREEGKKHFRIAARIREATGSYTRDAEYARVLLNLGIAYAGEGRYESAQVVLERSRRVHERADAWREPQVKQLLELLAQVYGELRKREEEEQTLRALLNWLQDAEESSPKEIAEVRDRHLQAIRAARRKAKRTEKAKAED